MKKGTIGKGCSYTLEDSGKFTIYPTDGVSGEMASVSLSSSGGGPQERPFNRQAIKSIVIEKGVKAPEDYSYGLFRELDYLVSIDLSGLDTSGATDLGGMFSGCRSLTSVDLSGLDISKVTSMSGMFYECSSLTSVDLSGLDTSRVTNMSHMFWCCSSLTYVDLSGWDTSQVTDMSDMFTGCGFKVLDLSRLDTSSVVSMHETFDGCTSLTSLDISGWDTSQVTDMAGMFGDCSALSSLDLSKLNTSQVTYMAGMFRNCSALSSITVGKGAGRMLSVEASGFPAGRDGRGWFSARDRRWFTAEELSPGRQGIADTYTTYGPGDEPKPEGRDVSGASVDAIPDQAWTGSAVEPRPTVRLGGRTLSEGTDYALSFGGNEGIGTATVTVTGRGSYTGTRDVTFRIGFSDVPAGHWVLTGDVDGEGYLAAVVRMGLMTGYGDPATGRLTGRFGPEDSVTRAQVVTVLYRYANPGSTDTTTGAHADNATSLSDNESGQYYTAAVNWAVRTGVVTGYTAGPDAGRFVPDREISREELATMVHRFAALEGADDSVPDSAYGGAPDAGDVSGWASGHVAWCYAHQVLTGHADTGLLEPQGTATRAQMAKMAVLTIKAMGR